MNCAEGSRKRLKISLCLKEKNKRNLKIEDAYQLNQQWR